MEIIGDIFIVLLLEPMLNGLVLLYSLLFHNMGLAILALTVIVRGAFYPLTVRQLSSSRKMQELQPRLEAIRARNKNNPQAVQRETMALYREAGVSPLGCLGPLVIQFPIWIGLYWAIIKGIGDLPGSLLYLSQHLYSWLPRFATLLPLDADFLWLKLTQPDPTPLLPLLVAGSTYLQQKIMQPAVMSAQQRQQQQMMLFIFPIMLGFLAFTFPSGLALYWLVSNLITVVMQYFISGWGGLRPGATPAAPAPSLEARTEDARESGSVRTNRGRSNRNRSPATRSPARRRRHRRS